MKADFSKFTGALSGAGAMTKAVLYFFPPSDHTITVSSAASKKNTANPGIPGHATEALGSAKDTLTEEKKQLQNMEERVKKATGGIEDPIDAEKVEQDAAEAENGFAVTFQFNPAALRISAYGGGMAPIMIYGSKEGDPEGKEEENSGGQMDYGPLGETVTVSFQVIFDALKNAYTVRPVVEGFLAAVRNGSARRVIFLWGGLLYGGYLNNVQCRYTMFDKKGEAVRAEVDLSLVSSGHEDHDEVKRWRKRYDAYMNQKDSIVTLKNGGTGSVTDEITGQVEKAYILFHTQSENQELTELFKKRAQRKKEKEEKEKKEREENRGEEAEDKQNQRKQLEREKEEEMQLKTAVFHRLSDMTAKISDAANRLTGEAPNLSDLKQTVEQAGYFPVRVWYNPSSITMHSRGGEMMTRDGGFGGSANQVQFQKNAMPTETVLSMELMFDGFVASISELFVAAIASDYSRLVCVVWNRMAFWGELCEAEVEYTMFDRKGNPLRSKVSIRIRQDGKSAENGGYEKNWQRAYKNLEKEAEKLLRM